MIFTLRDESFPFFLFIWISVGGTYYALRKSSPINITPCLRASASSFPSSLALKLRVALQYPNQYQNGSSILRLTFSLSNENANRDRGKAPIKMVMKRCALLSLARLTS
jgi:hypothetical protein